MMKKLLTLLLVLCAAFTATACSHATNQEYYEQAQLYLGSGDCEAAAMLFSQLGEYADSADYALYAAALHALQQEDLPLARANLHAVHPFKSSERYLRYLDALELEASGDLEGALVLYEALGSFEQSADKAALLRKEIPEQTMQEGRRLMSEGDYAAARDLFLSLEGYGQSARFAENCTVALNKAAYTEADALCDSGDHLAAMQAFEALGDALDAPDRAAQCRAALTAALDAALEEASIENAADLIALCHALGDKASLKKADELSARFAVNLQLLEGAADQPYVLLGAYPMGESGLESDLLWQVLKAEGAEVTLLCASVIDASPVATPADLTLTEEEAAAASDAVLPAVSDLTGMSDLTCQATPYAAAQGAATEGGLALYWLRDSLESGLHPVVNGTGSLSLPADDATPGVRPMLTLNLNDFAFSEGDGTRENPYR